MPTNPNTPEPNDSVPEDEERPLTVGEKHAHAMHMAEPIGKALMGRPIGAPARYEHKLRTEDMILTPPASYQSANITSIEGYGRDGTGLTLAVAAMDAMHAAIASIIDARRKSDLDPTLHNETAKVLKVSAFADKLTDAATKRVDTADKAIQAQIRVIEDQLQRAVEASTLGQMATEIRAHCKSQKNPLQFVSQVIASRDARSVSAVLGAPAFLSGLSEEMKTTLTRKWNAERDPTLTGKLKLLETASARLTRAGSQFTLTTERAMGIGWPLIQRLRAEQASAAFG